MVRYERYMSELAGWLAHSFHFPPSEIEHMTMDDMERWCERAGVVGKQIAAQQKQQQRGN